MTATWRRPCDTGECLEVSTDVLGLAPGAVVIRNSYRPGRMVVATAEDWTAFVAAVKAGRYDDLCGGDAT